MNVCGHWCEVVDKRLFRFFTKVVTVVTKQLKIEIKVSNENKKTLSDTQ